MKTKNVADHFFLGTFILKKNISDEREGVPSPLHVLPSGLRVKPFLHLHLYEARLLTQMCWH